MYSIIEYHHSQSAVYNLTKINIPLVAKGSRRCASATADRQMFRICVKSDGQIERERERERERDGSFSPVQNRLNGGEASAGAPALFSGGGRSRSMVLVKNRRRRQRLQLSPLPPSPLTTPPPLAARRSLGVRGWQWYRDTRRFHKVSFAFQIRKIFVA